MIVYASFVHSLICPMGLYSKLTEKLAIFSETLMYNLQSFFQSAFNSLWNVLNAEY